MSRFVLPVVGVFSLTGGVGRSTVTGLLAAGLAEPTTTTAATAGAAGAAAGPVVVVDGEPAGTSPWPAAVGHPVTPTPYAGPPPVRAVDVLDQLAAAPWGQPQAAKGRRGTAPAATGADVVVRTDLLARLHPSWADEVLTGLTTGVPGSLAGAQTVVVDGPAGQGTALWWAAQAVRDRTARDGNPSRPGPQEVHAAGLLARWLHAATHPDRTAPTFQVAVLVVPYTPAGLAQALTALNDLDTLGVPTGRLVVACTTPAAGATRLAKTRRELLRGRVTAAPAVPHDNDIARRGLAACAPGRAHRAGTDLVAAVRRELATLPAPPAPPVQSPEPVSRPYLPAPVPAHQPPPAYAAHPQHAQQLHDRYPADSGVSPPSRQPSGDPQSFVSPQPFVSPQSSEYPQPPQTKEYAR